VAGGLRWAVLVSAERVVMIPGMGADRRLFEAQRVQGFDFEVPELPIPGQNDDMVRYAARVRDLLNLDGRCVVGGVSFGGMVACELAALCNARCVLLIASCSHRRVLPGYYRWIELISRMVPDGLIRHRCEASSRMLARLESLSDEDRLLIRKMSQAVPVPFLRRVGRMILRWNGPRTIGCPFYTIHGAQDRIIPIRRIEADEVVPDGGHLINLTHAEQVNRFIARCLASG